MKTEWINETIFKFGDKVNVLDVHDNIFCEGKIVAFYSKIIPYTNRGYMIYNVELPNGVIQGFSTEYLRKI